MKLGNICNVSEMKIWLSDFVGLKAVLRRKLLALNAVLGKKSQINNLNCYLKEPEKEKNKPKASRRKWLKREMK